MTSSTQGKAPEDGLTPAESTLAECLTDSFNDFLVDQGEKPEARLRGIECLLSIAVVAMLKGLDPINALIASAVIQTKFEQVLHSGLARAIREHKPEGKSNG